MTLLPASVPHPAPIWTRLIAPPPGTSWSGIAFALRTTAASLIALYIAFLINLDSPKWAAMTVWIVAQANRGMTVSKARYRVLGTFAGTGMAVTLTALFAQAPELLLGALAVWVGLCTGVATALRNFRAYGAVLAGYTAAIITLDAAAAPSQIFDIAEARLIYILLGIGVEAVLSAILAPRGRWTTSARASMPISARPPACVPAPSAERRQRHPRSIAFSPKPWRSTPRPNMRRRNPQQHAAPSAMSAPPPARPWLNWPPPTAYAIIWLGSRAATLCWRTLRACCRQWHMET